MIKKTDIFMQTYDDLPHSHTSHSFNCRSINYVKRHNLVKIFHLLKPFLYMKAFNIKIHIFLKIITTAEYFL